MIKPWPNLKADMTYPEIKSERNPAGEKCRHDCEAISLALFDRLPKDQVERVFSGPASIEIQPDFLGFVDIYEALARIIPHHFNVVDLGCGYAPQAFYFERHKSYIGVDFGDFDRFSGSNTTHHKQTIQSYIEGLSDIPLDGPSFAICSYVPCWHGLSKKLITDTFEDVFMFYPKGDKSASLNFGCAILAMKKDMP